MLLKSKWGGVWYPEGSTDVMRPPLPNHEAQSVTDLVEETFVSILKLYFFASTTNGFGDDWHRSTKKAEEVSTTAWMQMGEKGGKSLLPASQILYQSPVTFLGIGVSRKQG